MPRIRKHASAGRAESLGDDSASPFYASVCLSIVVKPNEECVEIPVV